MNAFLFVKSIGTITEPSYDNPVFHFITNNYYSFQVIYLTQGRMFHQISKQ